MFKSLCLLLCVLTMTSGARAGEINVKHGNFGTVTIYRPVAAPTSVVLLLSGDGGWNEDLADTAHLLVAQGALVVGISVPVWQKKLESEGPACLYPDGELEELSHFVQASAKLPSYMTPYLVGYSAGASYVYAMLAQAPVDTFAGGLSVAFCQEIELRKPMCKGEDLSYTKSADGKGVDLKAGAKLRNPWAVLHGEADDECDLRTAREFVAATPGATLVTLPKLGHSYAVTPGWSSRFVGSFNAMRERNRVAAAPPPPSSLAGLPLVEVPAEGTGDYFAVMLSGDGGWAGMDKEIASELTAKGIPVAGWDSLRYFWSARTPAGLAADLDRVLRYYADHWKKPHAIVIGYSQGADVLSFGVNRLPPNSRALLAQSVMIAPGLKATFEFHFGNWFGGSAGGLPIPPEAAKLDLAHTLCIHGLDETDSLCPQIDGKSAHSIALPGAHHFNGDYKRVAAEIIGHLRDLNAPAQSP